MPASRFHKIHRMAKREGALEWEIGGHHKDGSLRHHLYEGLTAHYRGDDGGVDAYSQRALSRVWQAMRFSWSLTTMMHRFPGASEYKRRMQESELALLERSDTVRKLVAENYKGLPH
jgi:p-hydroxybenzoate 3-monooxygenase